MADKKFYGMTAEEWLEKVKKDLLEYYNVYFTTGRALGKTDYETACLLYQGHEISFWERDLFKEEAE